MSIPTWARHSHPQRAPLTISRHVTADKQASDGDRIVLDEAVTARVQGGRALRQSNRYVMDRQSAVNRADRRSYAFTPTNTVDRSGGYRLAFGFGVPEGQSIKLYPNDTDSTYTAVPDRQSRLSGSASSRLERAERGGPGSASLRRGAG